MFCLLLNAELLLVAEYHMMDMNIISLVTISLLMVSMCIKTTGRDSGGGWKTNAAVPSLMPAGQHTSSDADCVKAGSKRPRTPKSRIVCCPFFPLKGGPQLQKS